MPSCIAHKEKIVRQSGNKRREKLRRNFCHTGQRSDISSLHFFSPLPFAAAKRRGKGKCRWKYSISARSWRALLSLKVGRLLKAFAARSRKSEQNDPQLCTSLRPRISLTLREIAANDRLRFILLSSYSFHLFLPPTLARSSDLQIGSSNRGYRPLKIENRIRHAESKISKFYKRDNFWGKKKQLCALAIQDTYVFLKLFCSTIIFVFNII